MIFEFTGPFNSHNLQDLSRSNKNIKYPFFKRFHNQEAMSQLLQTPTEIDLRFRTDFVFGCKLNKLGKDVLRAINLSKSWDVAGVAGISLASSICAVAISAEIKSIDTFASRLEARHQWSSLAYLNLLERVEVVRDRPYKSDSNICQYGYLLCGLGVQV